MSLGTSCTTSGTFAYDASLKDYKYCASGTWKSFLATPLTSPQVFTYTGSNQTFTVPSGVTTLTVKIWGAGGGGGSLVSISW